ncbi:hypothetical protein BaRGS_00016251 [Batillaria attramentaria]|uniref:G-protein coupled receptors family 1 profile domain-containing protein n=1 Tax=Batillaria attramentaria TaxID=370345 RepID=A0ABD0KZR4_9CAEN|nr:hypothetical protein BaRGS_002489 [Batillaria attramentaria]
MMNSSDALQPDLNVTLTEHWFDTGWQDYNSSSTPPDYLSHNASAEYLPWKERVVKMWQVTCPILFILGNFDNVMVILIMRRMITNETGFPLLFMALAVTDLLFLYVVLLPHWVVAQFGYSIRDASEVTCKLQTYMVYSLVTLSGWLLAAMTAQRAIHIVWPFKMMARQPRRQALRTILILTSASFIFCSFALYGATTKDPAGDHCWWRTDLDPMVVRVYYCIATFLNTVLPFLVIIVCNCLMIRAVTMSASRQTDTHGGAVSRMTLTLIVVSFVFIVLTMPMYIMRSTTQRISEQDGSFFFWANFTDLMGVTNCAINFCLYAMTGSRFRKEVKRLFCKKVNKFQGSTRTTRNIDERGEHTRTADF